MKYEINDNLVIWKSFEILQALLVRQNLTYHVSSWLVVVTAHVVESVYNKDTINR